MSVTYNPSVLAHDVKLQLLDAMQKMEEDLAAQLCTVVTSGHRSESYPFMGEGAVLEELKGEVNFTPMSDTNYSLTAKEFVGGMHIKRSDLEDDAQGAIRMRVDQFAYEASDHRCQEVIDALVNGTSATLGLGYDGVAFFHDSHPIRGQQTAVQDNLLAGTGTTTAQFQTDLAAAISAMRSFRDERGRPANRRISSLAIVGPPGIEKCAKEALYAQVISNTSNVGFNDFSIKLIIDGSLADANDWYLLNLSKPIKPLIFQERTGFQIEEPVLHQPTQTYLVVGRARYVVGYANWHLAVKTVN